jgi:glutamine amidotransferase
VCRWLAYSGAPICPEELLFLPEHSLIEQSLAAYASPSTTNGDGFGVGWYGQRESPGLYRSIQPAWNDPNLRELAAQIRSRLFLAHVRATTGSAIQLANCHPFRHGHWLLVHNGLIEDYPRLKRDLVLAVDPHLYPEIQGTTDSELMLYLALTFGMAEDPVAGVERMVGFVEEVGRANGVENPMQMTLGISDGRRLIAVRYASAGEARTLYCSRHVQALEDLNPASEDFSEDSRVVVSEPLTNLAEDWAEIPESTALVIEGSYLATQRFRPRSPEGAAA